MTDDRSWGVEADSPPGEGWWRASDDRWYPPETAPGAAPTPPGVPPAQPPATSPGEGPGGDGGSRRGPALIIVAAVVAIGAIVAGIVLATSGGDDDGDDGEVSADATATAEPSATPTPTDEVTPSATATPEPTGTAEPTGTVAPTPTAEPTPPPSPTAPPAADRCRYLGIDSFGDMQISLELESPVTAESLVVGYTVFDPDGRVLVRSDVFVDLVEEGERLSLAIDTFTAAPEGAGVAQIDCEVGPVESAVPFFELLPAPDDATCAVAGLSDFDDVDLDVVFTSTASETVDVTVITGLYRDGARVATIPTFLDRLRPDEPIALAVETFETLPAGSSVDDLDCVLLGVVDDDFDQEWSDPAGTDVCVVTGADSFGDVQVELVVTNPFPEPIELDVLYVIRGPDGERIHSVFALTGTAEVAETVIVDHDSFSPVPDGLTALDLTCEILGILRF